MTTRTPENSKHVVSISEDFLLNDFDVECTCGAKLGSWYTREDAEKAMREHYAEVAHD